MGRLHVCDATTYARSTVAGRTGLALGQLDEALRVADRLGSYVHPWTMFSAWNVDLQAVAVHVDLGRSSEALDLADTVDTHAITSTDRRARYYADTAVGHYQAGDETAAIYLLKKGVKTSVETVRYAPRARTVVADLVGRGKRSLREDVGYLADAVGIAA